jgi:hypothetical protein
MQIICQKKNNIYTNNKLPQPHKIEAQKTKNLQELVEFQKLVHNYQTCHIKQKNKGHLVSWIGTT